jgi:pyridoxal phosphate enzyme (YggS family)
MTIAQNLALLEQHLKKIQSSLPFPEIVKIMAVTKYASDEQIAALIAAGIKLFGENKVQDAERKIKLFGSSNLDWHMIGHLQTNKVKKAVQLFACIQSVDSVRLLDKINNEAQKLNKKMPILLQLNLLNEESKFGFSYEEYLQHRPLIFSFAGVIIKGIMIIAPYEKKPAKLDVFFQKAKRIYDQEKKEHPSLEILSMGMSNDYEYALKNGANMIRVGSVLLNNKTI